MNFDNYLFHCSSLGDICTDPRSGKGLSETCKAHLIQCWIRETYGRTKGDTNKYIEKGNMVEEDSITLYSRVMKKMYVKNSEYFKNDFIIGTPDIIHEGRVVDIKSCWDIFTFFSNLHKPINKDYFFQLNGYWDLLKCDSAHLTYVLVNTPEVIIEQEKSRLRYKMGLIDPEANPVYLHAAEEIDKNGIFDDIPIEKRWMEFDIPKADMDVIYTRVKECRNFLNSLG